ncbi:hypothetical protein Tcan_13464 [Toxocara canis]|uniref:Uncharacterized protein n=1 Tax=Toxocara canis TaxID=6265 RepID=A0A0B2VIG5_TOXCA|nr:hypothetical protein Tcan_13464 [Toxocara canis]
MRCEEMCSSFKDVISWAPSRISHLLQLWMYENKRKCAKWNSRPRIISCAYFPFFSIFLPLTSYTREMDEPETALQQGRSRSLSHPVWQFYEVVQRSYKCPRCGGHKL